MSDADQGFADLDPWAWSNAVGRAGTASDGLMVRAADYRPEDGVTYAYAQLAGTVSADTVNRVEVDLYRDSTGIVALTWASTDSAPESLAGLRHAQVGCGAGEVETVVFDLGSHAAWRGEISNLRLYPSWRGPQSFEIVGIRFCKTNFSLGKQPGSDFGSGTADAGLLGYSGDLRRTWPTDSGVPLYASCVVPPGGRFVADVAVPPRLSDSLSPFHFALDVRHLAGQRWVERGRKRVVPARAAEGRGWHGMSADLSDLEGLPIELRLRGWLGSPDAAGVGEELEEDRFWWGNPLVIGTPPGPTQSNVLLITLDTLRVDAVGCYGGARATPSLDALADESLLFESAWTACNSTLPSHTSLLTGLSVPAHGVLDNRSTLAPEVRTLGQAFRQAGFHTAAAVSVDHLATGWSGLGRGFDQYLDVQPRAVTDGSVTVGKVLQWSEEWARQGERPTFLWVHLFDPHTPYGPPRPYLERFAQEGVDSGDPPPPSKVEPGSIGQTVYTNDGQFLEGVTNNDFARFLYDASVAYTDELVGDLLWAWKEAGRWDRTVVALTADHGESLGERGVFYGHQLLHEPVMRVPLILRVPGLPAGRTPARAWTPDISKTLVDMFSLRGIKPSGLNLADLAQANGERRVWFVHSGMDQVGCRDGDVHYWHNLTEYAQLGEARLQGEGEQFLYRPDIDPGLLHNLADVEPDIAAKYSNAMRSWLEGREVGKRIRAELEDADELRLDAMGYGGGDE